MEYPFNKLRSSNAFLLIILLLTSLLLNCEKKEFILQPEVTTGEVTDKDALSAIVTGEFIDFGAVVTTYGHCWSTQKGPTINHKKTELGAEPKKAIFSSTITNLKRLTKYYVRTYVISGDYVAYGNEIFFYTNDSVSRVSTRRKMSIIGATTARGGGDVTYSGGEEIIARGVCWSTLEIPTINDNITIDNGGMGPFTSELTNLIPDTKYYLRAYSTNKYWTSYGNQIFFFTENGIPSISTSLVSDIERKTAKSGGVITSDGGDSIVVRGVCWSAFRVPTIIDNITLDGSGISSYESQLQNLSPGTRYLVRAYATNSITTSYGSTRVFVTL